jgi:predicted CopG family antitoxin
MTKNVTLSDQAYAALARLKKPGQSFSDLVSELAARQRPSIPEVGGLLASDSTYWKRFAADRKRERRRSAKRVRGPPIKSYQRGQG